MASYIQGVTDYIPQIQPFKPDLNFYASVLQTKQSAYDAAQKKLGNLYGTLLYSPLSREENISRRDNFFKMIEQDIKKVSAMDLSLPQNQTIASSVFDPIIEDKYITHDMNFTKSVSDEIQKGESYRNCTDPDECGGQYWEEGISALHYRLNDYAKANRDEALGMSAPKFTPFVNVTDKALKWAKDMDLVVEAVSDNGQYIVKKQNGDQLAVPLLAMYTSVFGNDPAIKDMYRTSAYLNRKGYIEQNKGKYGGDENQAEDAYFNEVMSNTVKNLNEDVDQHIDAAAQTKTRSQTIRNKIKKDGIAIGDPLFDDFRSTIDAEQTSTEVTTYYDKLKQKISSLPNSLKDRRAMRNAIEDMVAEGYLKQDLAKTAYLFASTHNSVTDMQANPFALEAYKSSLNIKEKMVQFDLDIQKAIKLEEIKIGAEMAKTFGNGGFPGDYEGTPEAGGPGNVTGANADMYQMTEGERKSAGQSMFKRQNDYVNNTVTFLKSQINDPNADAASKQLAKNQLKSLLGNHYDDKTNQFVKDGIKYTEFTEMNFGPKNINVLYSNSKTLVEQNKNLYKGLYAKNAQISEEYDQYNLARNAYGGIIFKNNALVKNFAKASTDIKPEDKFFFDNLFTKMADGKFSVITSEDEYVRKMMATNLSGLGNAKEKDKFLRQKYQDNMGHYRQLYNSGAVPGIVAPNGMGIGNNVDGGQFANVMSWNVDYSQPAKFGNQALVSFYKNAMMAGDGAYKILLGSGHTDKEYASAETSSGAGKTLFNAFITDMMSGRFQSKDQQFKAPSAKISYADVAANDGNKVAVTLSNINPEWLKSKATGKEGQKTVFGIKLEDALNTGITMYLDKRAANNILTNQYKTKPGDAYLNAGLTYNISRNNAGKVSLRKSGNSIIAEGSLFGYDGHGNKKSVNITNTFDASLSGDALIKEYTKLFNNQEQLNIDFLQGGSLPKVHDEAALIKYVRDNAQSISPGGQSITDRINYFRSTLGY